MDIQEELLANEIGAKFRTGDVLINKDNGSRITILAIVADQYKYMEGDDVKYEFTKCIESHYKKGHNTNR